MFSFFRFAFVVSVYIQAKLFILVKLHKKHFVTSEHNSQLIGWLKWRGKTTSTFWIFKITHIRIQEEKYHKVKARVLDKSTFYFLCRHTRIISIVFTQKLAKLQITWNVSISFHFFCIYLLKNANSFNVSYRMSILLTSFQSISHNVHSSTCMGNHHVRAFDCKYILIYN